MRLSGKSILITGAASGIGQAVAEQAAREGAARLVLTDLNRGDDPPGASAVQWLTGDVADEGFWDAAQLGEIDHAVINAGVAGSAAIIDLDYAEWRRIMSVNLDGAFLSLRAALHAMRDGGSIVAVASTAGIKAEPGIAAYAASKAGLIQLAKVAAKEAATRHIRVNAIAPGGVETPIWYDVPMFAERAERVGRDAAFAEMGAKGTPLGRFARSAEIAEQIAFLLSEQAATMTGAVLVTDCGYSL
jgi:NAD(P)-dependent dehydrogenase (short-subunit alcohol dehydrogenase family)